MASASPEGKPYGIVHRDVTPANIMVAWNGAVKILDFGIARAVQELRTSQTDAGIVKGKMSYIAPELLQGQPADARSDLFSLGVVLHEMLSGRRLFVGENDLETLKLVSEMPVPRPSSRNPEVKPAFDEVVLRALARDPAKRYQSADEMSQDLERLVLRKRYAASSFVKQVRALVPQTESGVEAGAPVEIVFGQRDASAVIAEEVPPVAPPPPPAAAPAAAPSVVRALLGALRGARASWLPSLIPTTATLVLTVIVLRHSGAAPRTSAAPQPPARTPASVRRLHDAGRSVERGAVDRLAAARCAGHHRRHAHRARATAGRDAVRVSGAARRDPDDAGREQAGIRAGHLQGGAQPRQGCGHAARARHHRLEPDCVCPATRAQRESTGRFTVAGSTHGVCLAERRRPCGWPSPDTPVSAGAGVGSGLADFAQRVLVGVVEGLGAVGDLEHGVLLIA